MEDDGRRYETMPLDQSDEPELLQAVKEARSALIEQVHIIKRIYYSVLSVVICEHFKDGSFF